MTNDTAALTRRTVAAAIAATATVGVCTMSALADARAVPPAAVKDWLHPPTAPPFTIPTDYIGIHSDHGAGATTPAPTYAYDAVRSHDVYGADGMPVTQWATIERAPGVFDWRGVDAWIAAHPGKTRIWVLFGCPSFYQKYPREAWPYPYLPGGGSPPRDPQTAARFVSALLQRYPRQFGFVELWNEPNFGWSGASAMRDRWQMTKPGFFTGTATDLAAMARAVRAVLPSQTKLMAGAWEGQDSNTTMINSMLRFSAAPDGAGGTGRNHVGALSVHAYTYKNDPNGLVAVLRNYSARFKQAGYAETLDRYVTEIGAEAPGVWTANAPPLSDKIRTLSRWCMIPTTLGYKGVYLYKHSLQKSLGDPARVPDLAATISRMRDGLRGQTLTQAAVLADDTIWLAFANGTTLRA